MSPFLFVFIKSYYFIVCVYEKIFAGLFHFCTGHRNLCFSCKQ